MRVGTTTTFREAVGEDVATVLAFWHDAGADPSSTDDVEGVRATIAHPTSELLLAYRGSTLVGTAIVAWDGWRGTLYRVVVEAGVRRSGVASEMVHEAERRLAAYGCRRISILVLRDEASARAFWQAAGYGLDERIERFVKPLDPRAR